MAKNYLKLFKTAAKVWVNQWDEMNFEKMFLYSDLYWNQESKMFSSETIYDSFNMN